MVGYVSRRLLQSLGVLLGVSVIVFGLLHLTGDPTRLLLPLEAREEDVRQLRALLDHVGVELGLDAAGADDEDVNPLAGQLGTQPLRPADHRESILSLPTAIPHKWFGGSKDSPGHRDDL